MFKVHRLTLWSLFTSASYVTSRRNGGRLIGAVSN